jgi:hypothetical protein
MNAAAFYYAPNCRWMLSHYSFFDAVKESCALQTADFVIVHTAVSLVEGANEQNLLVSSFPFVMLLAIPTCGGRKAIAKMQSGELFNFICEK